ncbi:MAG: bifunctional pyr operon transcriptional regulator/uracil phosphoribosyltransferase PyrR [Syntrophaceae bacterium]
MTTQTLNPREIQTLLRKLVRGLTQRFTRWDDVVFIGIRSGGEYIARHLVRLLEAKTGASLPLGVLDIALYRDDLSKRLYPEVRPTEIPFDVSNKIVILVDDVINTGRTVRAAIEHIIDLGRPRRIYLLTLFDRGGRELPIQPDFVGRVVGLTPDKVLKILIPEDETALGEVLISEVKR